MLMAVLFTSARVVVAASADEQPAAPFAPVAWLAGCWHEDGTEAGSVEHWLAPAGNTMLGLSRTIRGGKTVSFEFMQLRLSAAGQLLYIAQPQGVPPTEFRLLSNNAGAVTFENPAHDFPQRVSYRQVSATRLQARIEGMRNGKLRGIDYSMTRVDCPGNQR
jgi:hypothetical protein